MKVLCVSDGSDDGYETVKLLADLLDRRLIGAVKVLIVTFPQRESPLWDKAYELWLAEDDLHQAMEIAGDRQLRRLEAVFEPHAQSIESEVAAGDPVSEVLHSSERFDADLVLLGVTSNDHARYAHQISSEIVSKSRTPVVVAYGLATPQPSLVRSNPA